MKKSWLAFLALAAFLISAHQITAETPTDVTARSDKQVPEKNEQPSDSPATPAKSADSQSVSNPSDSTQPAETVQPGEANKNAASEKKEIQEGLNPEAALLARISGIFNVDSPTSIYDFDIHDNNVEFVLDGSWESRLEDIVTISFNGGSSLAAFAPPVFTQTVNLSSWVFINKTWYFESAFTESFTKNSVAAGYIGNDDTFIKHIRVGNFGITFPGTYTFVTIGGGSAIEPGIMGTFAGDTWNADAIVRYDTAKSRELVLSGMNEISDELVPATSLIQGKWFVLPDASVSGGISVYVESDSGTYSDSSLSGRRWRKLNNAEFKVDGTHGVLELNTETTGSVAVVYSGNYGSGTTQGTSLKNFVSETRTWFDSISNRMPAGYLPNPADASYTTDLANRFLLTIEGQSALLVRERGKFSPFTLASRYRASGSEPAVLFSNSGVKPNYLDVADYNGLYVDLYRTDENAPSSIRQPAARFPLSPEFPLMYLPSYGGQKPDTDLCIRSRSYKKITSIALGANAIAGTILVSRNGINDTGFRFDDTSGILTLEKEPTTEETVRITWLDTDNSARNATFTLGGGIHWRPSKLFTLSLASALRWNITKTGYTDASETSPGSFVIASGIEYDDNKTKASTAFAFDVSIPDTTGYYRILGMEREKYILYPSASWYKATPNIISPVLGLPVNSTDVTLNPGNRIVLSGTDGDSLATIGDSSLTGEILSMDCALPSAQSWASAEILTGTKGNIDWRNAKSVSIYLKNSGTRADYDIFLQLGTGASDYYEDSKTIRTWKLTTPTAGSSWSPQTITLTDSDRMALSSGMNMRIIVMPSATASPAPLPSNPLQVNLRTGYIIVNGSGFTATEEPAFSTTEGKLSVQETTDPSIINLATSESSIIGRFNSGSVNTVLLLGFTPESSTDTVTVSTHFSAAPLSTYKMLSFFIYPETLPTDTLNSKIQICLTNPNTSEGSTKKALTVEMLASALTAGKWQKITVDLDSGSVMKDDNKLPAIKAHATHIDTDVSPTHLSIVFEKWTASPTPRTATDPPYYTVAIDEFFLHETQPIYTGRNESKYSWKKTGAVVSAGKEAIISDPKIAITSDSSVSNNKNDPFLSGTADGGITILKVKTEGSITVTNTIARVIDSTGYSVNAPFGPALMKEEYYVNFSGNEFKREDAFSFSGPISAGAATHLQLTGNDLVRDAIFNLAPRIPVTRAGNFTLSASSIFSQLGVTPRTDITNAEWGNLWQDTARYSISTGENNATKRTGKASLLTGWTTPNLSSRTYGLSGIMLDGEAASTYASTTTVSLGSSYEYTLSVPFKLGFSTLTPSWKRNASQEKTTESGGSYFSDTQFLGDSFENLSYFYKTPPINDLFQKNLAERIRDNGTFSRGFINRYGLDWRRPSFGNLSDLWIPDTVNSSITRTTTTDATVTNILDSWTTTIQCSMSALNIAGAYGKLHLFNWYDQDEISQLYTWNAVCGTGYFTWSLDTWHSVMLYFHGSGSLVTENTFHYDSPDIAGTGELTRDSIRLLWKRPGKDTFLFALVSRLTKLPLTNKREDSVTFTVTHSVIDTNTSTDTKTIAFNHVLKTGIGQHGEVSVSAGTEYNTVSTGGTTLQIILGIGGKLTY